MTKRIIIIHGRDTKPGQDPHARLLKRALLLGLDRFNSPVAARVRNGQVKVDYAYYGDINNRLMAAKSARARARLTAHCTRHDASCEPSDGLRAAITELGRIANYDKATYTRIMRDNKSSPVLDDLGRLLSKLSDVTTGGYLNQAVIPAATADMGAYFSDDRDVGKIIRTRLHAKLRPAIERGDDIMLISHSMGCIVAWDLMLAYAKRPEFQALRDTGNRVGHWMTLGCPLGEPGVKWNLLGRRAHKVRRYPDGIIGNWINIWAQDDFVTHTGAMRRTYKWMEHNAYCDSIIDTKVYNCFVMNGTSYPHKFYGYLANGNVAKAVHEWAG